MNGVAVDQTFQLGLQHHQAGRLQQAEKIYQQILIASPNHLDSLHLLGLIFHQTARHAEAIQLIGRATKIKPRWPEANYNLAIALRANGQIEEAIAAYNRAITQRPDFAAALSGVSNLYQLQGKTDEAISAYRRSLAIQPDQPDVQNNLGTVLQIANRLPEAINAYRKAISLRPNYPEALSNLAAALRQTGELQEAIAAYLQACKLEPFSVVHAMSLANALRFSRRLDQAIEAYQNVIALDPNHSIAHHHLGITWMEIGQADKAFTAFKTAAAIEPENASFHSAAIFARLYQFDDDPAAIAAEHGRWGCLHADSLTRSTIEPRKYSSRRLRIGYISPDFRAHPVGRFLLPLIEHHDHEKYEIFCYSDVAEPDEITSRFSAASSQWRQIAEQSHEQVTAQIREDAIDILVDLTGHSTGSRLAVFAQKPASVQMSYLGYPATTGVTAIDYRLTDSHADPPGLTEKFYTEKLYRLPRTNWCFEVTPDAPPIAPPPFKRSGHITFGSFNNLAKLTDRMLKIWCNIVRQVPDSHLLLKATALTSSLARDRVFQICLSEKIDPLRLQLIGPERDHQAHLSAYSKIDIALDTYPYHGTTTTCEAMWMGVPVISLAGPSHVSRVGVSLLSNVGLEDLIADTPSRYIDLAITLANNPNRLEHLRSTLRPALKLSPLMDAPGFARDFEQACQEMLGEATAHPMQT